MTIQNIALPPEIQPRCGRAYGSGGLILAVNRSGSRPKGSGIGFKCGSSVNPPHVERLHLHETRCFPVPFLLFRVCDKKCRSRCSDQTLLAARAPEVITASLSRKGTGPEGVDARRTRPIGNSSTWKNGKQVELAEPRARAPRNFKERIGSRDKMLEEKANLELAQILNREAKVALNEKTIRAPMSGIVVRKYKEAGESADRVEKLIDLVNIDEVYVRFYLDQKFIETVKLDQSVKVRFPLLGNAEFTGKVTFIDPRIELRPHDVPKKS